MRFRTSKSFDFLSLLKHWKIHHTHAIPCKYLQTIREGCDWTPPTGPSEQHFHRGSSKVCYPGNLTTRGIQIHHCLYQTSLGCTVWVFFLICSSALQVDSCWQWAPLCPFRHVLLCLCSDSVLRAQFSSLAQDSQEFPVEEAVWDGEDQFHSLSVSQLLTSDYFFFVFVISSDHIFYTSFQMLG